MAATHSIQFKDITGQRFGMLLVTAKASGTTKCRNALWLCQCDCGRSTVVRGTFLRYGSVKSCGCTRGRRGQAWKPLVLGKNIRGIPLTRGAVAIIDKEDLPLVIGRLWYLRVGRGRLRYAVATGKDSNHKEPLHRVIMKAKPGQIVDHIDGNGLNNRRSNLRFCTSAENSWNSKNRSGSSKYRGVCWDKRRGLWQASIRVGRKRLPLG